LHAREIFVQGYFILFCEFLVNFLGCVLF